MAHHHHMFSVFANRNTQLKRLGDFFIDPQNFGSSTHDILKATSAKYQVALDKCEIQILNAKWILEYQLAQARAKREASKPVEIPKQNKRKLEETEPTPATEETPSKKQKNVEPPELDHLATLDDMLKDLDKESKPEEIRAGNEKTEAAAKTSLSETPATSATDKASAATAKDKPKQPDTEQKPPGIKKEEAPGKPEDSHNIDFDSMFVDLGDNDNTETTGMNFDDLASLDADNSFDMMIAQSQENKAGTNDDNADGSGRPRGGEGGGEEDSGGPDGEQTLNSLLPGLESYANSNPNEGNSQNNNTTSNNNDNDNDNNNQSNNSETDDFNTMDLPEITDTTTFDDLFGDMENAGGFDGSGDGGDSGGGGEGGGGGGGRGVGNDDDYLLNDDSIRDLGTFDDDWLMNS